MPARTALPSLERAMEAANIPYRVESASLVFETQEIRDLLNCLKAIDNPADQVATVAALRSVAFGCSDVELFRHHQAGGRFDFPGGSTGFPSDGPVSEVPGCAAPVSRGAPLGVDRFPDRPFRAGPGVDGSLGGTSPHEGAVAPVPVSWWSGPGSSQAAGGGSLRAFIRWVEDQMGRGSPGHRVPGARVRRGIRAGDDRPCGQGAGVPGGGPDRHQLPGKPPGPAGPL